MTTNEGGVGEAIRRQVATRDAVFAKLVETLRADERVLGAWLSGSFGRAEDDEWSDFDLQIAIEDDALAEFLEQRPQLYAAIAEPILIQDEMPSDNLSMGDAVFQLVYFRGAVLVDWNIGPASKATKPAAFKLLFERRPFPVTQPPPLTPAEWRRRLQTWATFFWAMAPIAVKYCARGSTREAASQTGLLARALICLRRLLNDHNGPDPWLTWMNLPTEDETDAWLPRTGVTIDPAAVLGVIREQCGSFADLGDELSAYGVDLHAEMANETQRLLDLAERVVAAGRFPERRYR